MKVMRKEKILQKDHGDYVRAERDLLTAVVHPYIVTMRYRLVVLIVCVCVCVFSWGVVMCCACPDVAPLVPPFFLVAGPAALPHSFLPLRSALSLFLLLSHTFLSPATPLLTLFCHPHTNSFQTASKLYLVLDFINGGHLFFNLYRQVRVVLFVVVCLLTRVACSRADVCACMCVPSLAHSPNLPMPFRPSSPPCTTTHVGCLPCVLTYTTHHTPTGCV